MVCVALHPGWVRTDFAPNGPVEAATSVDGLLKVMLTAGAGENGRFIAYNGDKVPW